MLRFASLAFVLLTAPAFAQTSDVPLVPQPAPTPPARPITPVAPAPPAPVANDAPPEVRALKTELDELDRYLRRKGSVAKDDHPAIAKLLEKVKPHAAAQQPLAMAMQVQLATWLGDNDLVDATYKSILGLNPKNEVALAQWFQALNRRSAFEQCVSEALAHNTEVAASPRATVPVLEALLNLNRIGEAKARVDAVTLAPTERPDVSSKINGLKTRIDQLFPLWQAEDAQRQADQKADNLPRVELVTSKGPLVIELYEDQAPNSVAAFLGFAESGQYAGTSFHKRVPNVGLVGGDPNSKAGATGRPGFGTPGYRIPDETAVPGRRMALSGTIGLAKAEAPMAPPTDGTPPARTIPNTAGATFFLLTSPAEHVHGECVIIGRVISGLEILPKLAPSDRIESAKVLRKREHEYTVTKAAELPTAPELTIPMAMPAFPMQGGSPGGRPPLPSGPGIQPIQPTPVTPSR